MGGVSEGDCGRRKIKRKDGSHKEPINRHFFCYGTLAISLTQSTLASLLSCDH